ncbi:response regulator [Ilyobacter polytropus]|uniref:Response regulator receiver protein n=1 Tax=Ilyobacter polytropus (strain ATCC 51220 / DSM 2926 / LMG 16218 / CuHBu1) TaxID=572544 RepID=E3H958_ILYPC|nr:response regulator [Ilyobacter polytropus]ADO82757.1 response regulator receiver protein [Ilyobacter polytropus DSM 2926]
MNFYIVDDDPGIQKILKNILIKNKLGEIVGTANEGAKAIEDIKSLKPDIVLADLLLPKVDGIGIVNALRNTDIDTNFIMISEVRSPEMISRAYESGVEFFITKPINVVEVLSVIKKVQEKIKMSNVIASFESAFKSMDILRNNPQKTETEKTDIKKEINIVLGELGILGDLGCNDISDGILWIKDQSDKSKQQYKLSDVYTFLRSVHEKNEGIEINTSTIEQRIRRTISKVLQNISNLGIEDYGNEIFLKYSGTIFDFKEVRKQMDFERGKSPYCGKISVKKFFEGILLMLKI